MKTYILRDPKAVQPQNRKPNPPSNPLPVSVPLALSASTELRRCDIVGGQHDDVFTTKEHQCTQRGEAATTGARTVLKASRSSLEVANALRLVFDTAALRNLCRPCKELHDCSTNSGENREFPARMPRAMSGA